MRTGSTCSTGRTGRVYAGVMWVAVQGDTTIRCSQLTIVFERDQEGEDEGDAIRRIECEGAGHGDPLPGPGRHRGEDRGTNLLTARGGQMRGGVMWDLIWL